MINEEYVTFESAKLLKEAGFPQDEYKDLKVYFELPLRGENGCCNRSLLHGENAMTYERPTQAQAMRWLRECHHLSVRVNFIKAAYKNWFWDILNTETEDYFDGDGFYPTYEAAAEAGIQAACEYLIEKGGEG